MAYFLQDKRGGSAWSNRNSGIETVGELTALMKAIASYRGPDTPLRIVDETGTVIAEQGVRQDT